MNNPAIYISAQHLRLGYSGTEKDILFRDIDVSLEGGRLVCFMGANGIGKSTLLRTLAGLQKPLAGSITYPAKEKEMPLEKWISLVLTDKVTAPNMTVRELVSLGRYPYLSWGLELSATDATIIDEAIRATRIEQLIDNKVDELSDGQRQLAMIARALAQHTPVILLDEPTAHLDLNNRVEIMRLLRTVARTMKKAILVATHELDLALQTADLLWVATAQKTIAVGMPEDLVLNGTLDEIFNLKGFDLKTGKVNHEPHKDVKVNLTGSGYEFLWTKNALEREGYSIDSNATITIEVNNDSKKIEWTIATANLKKMVFSISQLLAELRRT